ncbi:MAG: DHHW family protein [Oscillospiraceae bacterium]|jgi:hypothetical protein
MSKRANWVQNIIFLAFIFLFFFLNIILPDKDFSEQENRKLAQSPKFTFSSLFSGDFTKNFETYTTDQFAFRDSWITLKAFSELTAGKKENNGVYLCEKETLIEGFEAPDFEQIDANLAALESLLENVDVPVYFSLIPGAAEIWSYKLPPDAPNDSQLEIIEYAYKNTSVNTVDMYSALKAHADEYIYYRTDHHWTTLGAYYGYTQLAKAMGFESSPLSSYTPRRVSDSFYGTVYSSSGFTWISPDSIDIFVEEDGVKVTNYPSGAPVAGTLYDESFLEKKDKYSFFLGDNTPLLQITTDNEDAPSLLIIRDSYMDSLTPFLLENFSQLHIVDLRYYKTSLADYIKSHDIDNILVCYSVVNYCTDNSIFLLGR